jgi:photosystem II stability/assembly factor-like uncharacterized protein
MKEVTVIFIFFITGILQITGRAQDSGFRGKSVAANDSVDSLSWVQLQSGTTIDLKDVYFIDNYIGYAVGGGDWGSNGIILKTLDGGESWVEIGPDPTPVLISVVFTDALHGYAAGYEQVIKTGDGGVTWSTINAYYDSYYGDLSFPAQDTGFLTVCSDKCLFGIVNRTDDGGNTWDYSFADTIKYPGSIFFPNKHTGYVAGDFGLIMKTSDGGTIWITQSWGFPENLYSVYFPSPDTGYILGYRSDSMFFYSTTNGGNYWMRRRFFQPVQLNAQCFTNDIIGYVVGNSGIIMKTWDAGNSWQNLVSGTDKTLNAVYFSGAETGYVVGNQGIILKTTNGGTGVHNLNKAKNLWIYPNPASSMLYLDFSPGYKKTSISVLNPAGQVMFNYPCTGTHIIIDIGSLSPGIYFLRVGSKEGFETLKFVRE